MNNKQSNLDKILKVVVECCDIDIDGQSTVTCDDVRGQCRKESVCMTRCIFVSVLMLMGYSRSTVAAYIHRDPKSIGRLLGNAHELRMQSRAYQFAEAESILRTKNMEF